MIRGNAELQRNLWLEITPQRLIAAPAIIGLIVAIIIFGSRDPAPILRYAAVIGFVAVAALWGARLAAQSLTVEFAEGTWDGQRISGLSAEQMVAGKLLGGAAFAWYAGAGCLLVFLAAAVGDLAATDILRVLLGLVLLALLTQALSLLSTMLAWRRLRRVGDGRRRGLGLVLLVFLISPLAHFVEHLSGAPRQLVWFDRPWPAQDFALASLAAFAGWALLGALRAMRAELQFRNRPWIWIAFVVFLQVYAAGWIGPFGLSIREAPPGLLEVLDQPLLLRLMLAAAIALALAYAFVFTENKSPLRWLRLRDDLRAHRYAAALDAAPFWLLNAALAVLGTALLLIAVAALRPQSLLMLAAGSLAVLLYALRDIAVVLWCSLGPNPRRADGAAAVYLAVLYLLLPALLLALRWRGGFGFVLPWPAYGNPVWLGAALVWAAAALDLLWRRWRDRSATQFS